MRAGRAAGLVMGIIGFILSPASWWNDLAVNIPIAAAIASIIHRIAGIGYLESFIACYWATNILGVMLLALGASTTAGAGLRKSLLAGVAASTVYTILVVILVGDTGVLQP